MRLLIIQELPDLSLVKLYSIIGINVGKAKSLEETMMPHKVQGVFDNLSEVPVNTRELTYTRPVPYSSAFPCRK